MTTPNEPRATSRKTHASLFSGIGGFDLAARWAGWTNLFNCEIDPFGQRVLKHHFPDAKQYSDIKTTDFTVWRDRVDVLSGGFPCQPFSLAGKRKGTEDARHLWPEMLRAIREIRPTWIVGENVIGITSMVLPREATNVEKEAASLFEDYQVVETEECRFVIDKICEDIEQAGYSVQPIVIPACGVGAPHRRDRVWFVAHRTDARVEGVRERENGVLSDGAVVHPHGQRWAGRSCKSKRKHRNTSEWRDVHSGTARLSRQRITTHATSRRWPQNNQNIKPRQFEQDIPNCGGTSQLNPLFVAEMMGFPPDWTVLPFQSGDQKA